MTDKFIKTSRSNIDGSSVQPSQRSQADVEGTSDVPEGRSPTRGLPIAEITEAVARVRHGTVQLIIQDGRIVQIDTLEKRRLV